MYRSPWESRTPSQRYRHLLRCLLKMYQRAPSLQRPSMQLAIRESLRRHSEETRRQWRAMTED